MLHAAWYWAEGFKLSSAGTVLLFLLLSFPFIAPTYVLSLFVWAKLFRKRFLIFRNCIPYLAAISLVFIVPPFDDHASIGFLFLMAPLPVSLVYFIWLKTSIRLVGPSRSIDKYVEIQTKHIACAAPIITLYVWLGLSLLKLLPNMIDLSN